MTALSGILAGAVLGVIGGLVYCNYTHEQMLAVRFSNLGSEAQLLTRELELLRQGDTAKTIDILESELDSTLLQMAFLREQVPSIKLNESDERKLAVVRSYRKQHSSPNQSESVRSALEPMLVAPTNRGP